MKFRLKIVIFFISFLFLLSSCEKNPENFFDNFLADLEHSNEWDPHNVEWNNIWSYMSLELSTSKSQYVSSETVYLTLKAINEGKKPVMVQFSHDFVIERNKNIVWDWDEVVKIPDNTPYPMEPNEPRIYSTSWDQKDNEGNLVSTGTYEVYGVFLGSKTSPSLIEIIP